MKHDLLCMVTDKKEWKELLKQCREYDFYHTYDYHELSELPGTYKLLKFLHQDTLILFPIIIRHIPGTNYNDITSSYGYAGPVSNKSIAEIPGEIIQQFQVALLKTFDELNVVSAFARLHTLFCQAHVFENLGEVLGLNQTVFIDLQLSPEIQRAQYGNSTKTQVNKLKRLGFTVRKASSDEDLDAFISIYYATMDRLNAKKEYYFSKKYFQTLLNATDFSAFILLAEKDNKPVAGSIFTSCTSFMQYHLSGTADAYLKYTPMKLLLDEARLIANELNLAKFNLGGGYSGGNDSLLEFKSSFSKNQSQFKVWRYIANEPVYNELVSSRFDIKPDTNFFPLYRFQ